MLCTIKDTLQVVRGVGLQRCPSERKGASHGAHGCGRPQSRMLVREFKFMAMLPGRSASGTLIAFVMNTIFIHVSILSTEGQRNRKSRRVCGGVVSQSFRCAACCRCSRSYSRNDGVQYTTVKQCRM